MAKTDGYFKYILAMDCETTGLCFGTDSPVNNPITGERHQTVSWGLMVIDTHTLECIDQMYVELKWTAASIDQRKKDHSFGKKAEQIHGLTKEYLDTHGLTEEQAIEQIWEMVGKYWSLTSCIRCLGHNVHLFDLQFFKDLFHRNGVKLRFGNRHVDNSSISFAAFETYTSDQIFALLGFTDRKKHNALDDIQMTVAATKAVRDIVQRAIKTG